MAHGYIVRADYYPDGEILPLGITDSWGKTHLFRKVKRIVIGKAGRHKFECISDERQFVLLFDGEKWLVIEQTDHGS